MRHYAEDIPNLDFLPPRYREATAQRHTVVWRAVVAAVFVAFMVLAAVGQYGIKLAAEHELSLANEQYSMAQAQMDRFQRQQVAQRSIDDRAALLAYLHQPWPRTRILATLVEALPTEVTLRSLRIEQEMPPAAFSTQETSTDTAATLTGAAADLAQLRLLYDRALTVVVLEGETTDDVALHSYLGRFADSTLFAKATITAIESGFQDSEVSTFTARLVVRPSFGQPGGPQATTPPAEIGQRPAVTGGVR